VVALIVLSRQRPRKEHSADRSAELMRFRKPVSAYLHFIKTTSRRCPDINPNPKQYCEFCSLWLRTWVRAMMQMQMPAATATADPQLSVDVGYVVKTKLHYAISPQPPSFLSRSPFLPGSFQRRIRARTDLFTTTQVQVFTLIVYFNCGTVAWEINDVTDRVTL